MEFVDQISQPEMFAPRPRDTALSFSSETTIPMPNSSWPVTILLTFNIIVASSVRVECVCDDPRLRNEYIVAIRPARLLIPMATQSLRTTKQQGNGAEPVKWPSGDSKYLCRSRWRVA
jgi:hypothetical protein